MIVMYIFHNVIEFYMKERKLIKIYIRNYYYYFFKD